MSAANRYSGPGVGSLVVMAALVIAAVVAAPSCRGNGGGGPLAEKLTADQFPMDEPMVYDWSVTAMDGSKLNMSELKGKTLFINVWATWCPPCRAEMPSIQKLYESMSGEGVTFVLLSNEDTTVIRSFLERNNYTLPVYQVGNPPRVLSSNAIPTTFVVSPEGRVVLKHVGGADWNRDIVHDFLRRVQAAGGQ